MDGVTNGANLLLEKLREQLQTAPDAAICMISITTSLFKDKFSIQFELYKLAKTALDHKLAADNFQNCYNSQQLPEESAELAKEVGAVVGVLRALDTDLEPLQDFYLKMFHCLPLAVQLDILRLTVDYTDQKLKECRFVMLILRQFPAVSATHAPKLLETMLVGMKTEPAVYQAMLLDEVLPFVSIKALKMDTTLVTELYTEMLSYFMRQLIEDPKGDTNEIWKKIFDILGYCARILKWVRFLPFREAWGQNKYWSRLLDIASGGPSDSMQVLYFATTLFTYSLHCYISKCSANVQGHVLVEGWSNWYARKENTLQPSRLTVTTEASKHISMAFSHAAQCWQLLNTDSFQLEFNKLLLSLPLAEWCARFLFDLSVYVGNKKSAKKLIADITDNVNLVANLQTLSLDMLNGALTLQGFECIMKILAELPTTPGRRLEQLTVCVPRHTIWLPLAQRPVIQYCAKALANVLLRKLTKPTLTDRQLGDLLVLLQLEYPGEEEDVDQAFAIMAQRGHFSYALFSAYIVNIEFIEQLMFLADTQKNFCLDLKPAKTSMAVNPPSSTIQDCNRSIIRQQVMRANDDVFMLVADFIKHEKLYLMQHLNT